MGSLGQWLKKRLTRVTSSGRFIPQIDGLRFVAIASVVFFHMTGWLFPQGVWPEDSVVWSAVKLLPAKGYYGVEIFFMISGFILALPMAERHLRGDHRLRLGKYFTRRIARLEPPFLLSLLVFWLFWHRPLMNYLGHLGASMIHAHGPIYQQDSVINHVVWSLEVEVQFYIVAPFLACIFMVRSCRLRRTILLAAMAGLVVLDVNVSRITPYVPYFTYSTTLLGKGVYFLPGFLLVDVYLVDWKSNPPKSWWWDLIGIAGWIGVPVSLYLPGDWKWLVLLAQWAGFVGAFRGRWLHRLFAHPLLTVIGGMCYTIYLYHPPAINWAGLFVTGFLPETAENFVPRFFLISALATVWVLIVSTVLFLLVERPCMKKDWPARLLAWLRGTNGQPALSVEPIER